MTRTTRSLIAALVALSVSSLAGAHCQIPCGIYDDELRVQLIEEHAATIEKSMNQIIALGKESPVNFNQLARWVRNKEEHAQKVQDIVTAYFMTQRVKIPKTTEGDTHQDYLGRLALLHEMLVTAMKAKQTTDVGHARRLAELARDYRKAYLSVEPAQTKVREPPVSAGSPTKP